MNSIQIVALLVLASLPGAVSQYGYGYPPPVYPVVPPPPMYAMPPPVPPPIPPIGGIDQLSHWIQIR
ncbi:hypothetical protein ANCDUO_08701 [Ancylostoma duodenale]|uniref:Uncharacterized protein n=1 Tax=Ancylostoma duodenale TaxID=51022 RepID=A0A0C2CVV7_9BILA|nr:hypothetical protein ANCDUO_08701 [Ancylostoma duodenale]